MKANASNNARPLVISTARILLFSLAASFFVLVCTLLLQWLIYDDWLHRTGPLRLVGTSIAAVLTFVFIFRWEAAARAKQLEMLRRFETIKRMNDRIRNALQVIECTTYAQPPDATQHVHVAVNVIDRVLRDVLAAEHPGAGMLRSRSAGAPDEQAQSKSA